MKKIICLVLLSVCCCISFAAEQIRWESTFAEAQKKAQKEKKPVFLFFTGSDWCIWCKKLDREIMSKPEFIRFASPKMIFYKADFPHANKPPEAVAEANKKLAAKYGVPGYPTIKIIRADGKVLGTLGYMNGGPEAFNRKLSAILR